MSKPGAISSGKIASKTIEIYLLTQKTNRRKKHKATIKIFISPPTIITFFYGFSLFDFDSRVVALSGELFAHSCRGRSLWCLICEAGFTSADQATQTNVNSIYIQ